MSQTYESRIPSILTDPGQEVLLVQTRSGVPARYGPDHEAKRMRGVFLDKDAALEDVRTRGQLRDVITLTRWDVQRVDLLMEVIRYTRVGTAVDEYRIFNA